MKVVFIFLAFALVALGQSPSWTLGTGNTNGFTSFWAGNFSLQSFNATPEALCTNGSCPNYVSLGNSSAGFTVTSPAGGPVPNSFYVFPFSSSANCGTIGCPNLNPNNVSSTNGGRAIYLEAGEKVIFTFTNPIGAFGLRYAVSSPNVLLTADFFLPLGVTPTATASIPTVQGGPLTALFLAPTNVFPRYSAQFTQVVITTNASTWFVFNDLYYGQTGYQCINFPSNIYALSINLLNLPNTTWVSYDGDASGSNFPVPNGGSIYQVGNDGFGIGNQIVIICVPGGNPYVSVYDQTLAFHSWVDGGNITCSTGHVNSTRCYLDPRANYTVPLPCIPSVPNSSYSLQGTLWWDGNGPALVKFRDFVVNSSTPVNPTMWVLATKNIFSSLSIVDQTGFHVADTLLSSPSNCRKSNSIPYPAICSSSGVNGPISNWMQFRTKCFTDPNVLPMPTNVTVNITYNTDLVNQTNNVQLSWLNLNVGNTDFAVCVPALGDFYYNAVEYGINPVTTDDASVNCSPNLRTSRCNTTPLDLVSILQGPQVCQDVPLCSGGVYQQPWVGGNASGFPYTLSYGTTPFRAFTQSPFQRLRQCVLNLNEVRVSAEVAAIQQPLASNLVASYDCTWTNGNTPGVCAPSSSNPLSFFSTLRVDSLGLPVGINYRVNLVQTSIEYGQVVCSTGSLTGTFCSAGNQVQYICVPAIGSDLQPLNCTDDYRPLRLELEAQECGDQTCFDPAGANACRPPSERCITLQLPLDCRQGYNATGSNCTAKLAQELCIWDLLALPAGSQTVQLLPASTNYNNVVRNITLQGGKPASYYVLGTDLRVRITESNTSSVTSGVLHCQYKKPFCSYNDFLSILNIDEALTYNGDLVLEGVTVTIDNLPNRSPYTAGRGCPRCNKKIAVLADSSYNLTYQWLGQYSRTITGISCTACPVQRCSPLPSIVRWFAIDPTCPVQDETHLVLDGIGSPVAQDNDENFKFYGNPWPTGLIPTISDHTLYSTPYNGTICQSVAGQQNYRIYYVLATSTNGGDYNLKVNLGCDSETYRLHCPVNLWDTGIVSCPGTCPSTPAKYNNACQFDSYNTTGWINVGPLQTSTCSGSNDCESGWKALTPLMNVNVDLRCLPDGSSPLGTTLPPFATNQNNYRGANYTDFSGTLTNRTNPIDIKICCGCTGSGTVGYNSVCNGCGSCTPNGGCGYQAPAGISCANPVVLREAGGYQNVFCGLYHQVSGPGTQSAGKLRIKVQELFRSEASGEWEEARPSQYIGQCPDYDVNAEWQRRVESKRPTVCEGSNVQYNRCGPSRPGRLCSATYTQNYFISYLNKTSSQNELALKFTYSLGFLSQWSAYFPIQDPTPWNQTRAHTLLRPNKLAALPDTFCVIRDSAYLMQVNDDFLQVRSPPVFCSSPWAQVFVPQAPAMNCTTILPIPPTTHISLQNVFKK